MRGELLVGERLDRVRIGGDLLLVGLGEAALAVIDQKALGRLSGVELLVEDLDDLGGLGRLRQERRGVVLRLVGQLRAERRERGDSDDPDARR